MKKLLALTLSVVLVLSLTVVASAATFDPYIGGRITWAYKDGDQFEDDPVTLNNGGIKLLLRGRVTDEATGTWGAIGAKIDGWPDNNGSLGESKSIYDFGINNIGGSNFSIWYSNWENENMNRGQGRIYNVTPAMYHEDMMFDRDMSNVIGIDYKTDNLIINFGYVPDKIDIKTLNPEVKAEIDQLKEENKTAEGLQKAENEARIKMLENADSSYDVTKAKDNAMQIAATYLFDGGDVHVGHYIDPEEWSESIIGCAFDAGFGTIKADHLIHSPDDGDSSSITQVGVSFDALNFDITLVMDDKYRFETDGGYGYQIRYTGIENVTFCYKAMEAEDKKDEEDNFTDLYVGYKYGVLETRLGYGTEGEGDDNDFVYASVYVNFW